MNNEKNIYQRINAVMKKVSYIKKDATIQGYKAVTHDNVISQVRSALIENGIIIAPTQIDGKLHDKGMKYDFKLKQEVVDPMRMYEAKYDVRFYNIDNPSEFISIAIESQALDNGDKAPGKALSYAVKYAILKLFAIETGENEESRNYDPKSYSDAQKLEFDEIIESQDGLTMLTYQHTIGPDLFTSLYNSFEKGKIVSGKKTVDNLLSQGLNKIDEIAHEIKESIKINDPATSELGSELTRMEKTLVAAKLNSSEIEYLTNMAKG